MLRRRDVFMCPPSTTIPTDIPPKFHPARNLARTSPLGAAGGAHRMVDLIGSRRPLTQRSLASNKGLAGDQLITLHPSTRMGHEGMSHPPPVPPRTSKFAGVGGGGYWGKGALMCRTRSGRRRGGTPLGRGHAVLIFLYSGRGGWG